MKINELVPTPKTVSNFIKGGMKAVSGNQAPFRPSARDFNKELKHGSLGSVNNVSYKYDANKGWLDANGQPAQGIAKRQLMRQYGRDDSGNPLSPTVGQKISQKLGGPFGQGTDPNAGIFTKAMAKVGSALGRGAAALIRPKAQPTQEPAAQEPATQEPAAQAKPNTSGAQGAQSGNAALQNLNNYVKGVAGELSKPGVDKVALTKELVNFMADRKGTPEWDNASTSIKTILKRAGLDPKFANTAWQRIQAGQTLESIQFMFINSLLEELHLSFADIGLKESVIETDGVKHFIVEDIELVTLKKLAGI